MVDQSVPRFVFSSEPLYRTVLITLFAPVLRTRSASWWARPLHVAAQVAPIAAMLAAGLAATGGRDVVLAAALDRRVLVAAVVAAACYAASALSAVVDVHYSLSALWARLLAHLTVLAAATLAVTAGVVAVTQERLVADVFVEAPVVTPSRPTPTTTPVQERPAPTTTSVGTTIPAEVPTERFNLLLIGSDAGPGRYGARADSLNVVSIGPSNDDVAVIAIPRNLRGALVPVGFEPILQERFDDLINAAHTWATSRTARTELVAAVLGPTDDPGWTFTAALVAETTGLRIDAWAAVDMAGFIEVIDAFGGLQVHVPTAVPAPGNVPAGKHPLPATYEPGWQFMDGTDALGYVRSRSADSDYQRMRRQRCVLASLAAQNSPAEVAAAWSSISAALRAHVRTNLDPGKLLDLVDVLAFPAERSRTLALVPPVIEAGNPDPYAIRAAVAAFIDHGGSPSTVVENPSPIPPPSAVSPPAATAVASTCKVRP